MTTSSEQPTDHDLVADHPFEESPWPNVCGYGGGPDNWIQMCGYSQAEHVTERPTIPTPREGGRR